MSSRRARTWPHRAAPRLALALLLLALVLVTGPARSEPEPELPPAPDWDMPGDAQLGARALAISQASTCAPTPSSACALRLAELRGALAVDHADRGEPRMAAALIDQVISAALAEQNEQDSWINLLNQVADEVHRFGSLDLERSLRGAALHATEARSGAASSEHTAALLRLAAVERDLGLVDEARAHAEEALRDATDRAPAPSAEAATAHLILGKTSWLLHDYAGARTHLEEALGKRALLFGAESAEVAEAHLWLGSLVGTQRDALAGERHLREAARTLDALGLSPELQALAYARLARVLRNDHDSAGGAAADLRGLEILGQHGSRDRWVYAALWSGMVDDRVNRHQISQALTLEQRAGEALAQAGLDRTRDYAVVSMVVGTLLRNSGRSAEARTALERAVALQMQLSGPDDWSTGTAIRELGMVMLAQGEERSGRANLMRALQIHTAYVGPYLDGVSERVGQAWLEQTTLSLQFAIAMNTDPEATAELWSAAMTWKGAVRAAAARRQLTRPSAGGRPPELAALLSVRRELSEWVVSEGRTASEAQQRHLRALLEQKDQLERALAAKMPAQVAALRDATLNEVCAALPAHVALVEFVRYLRIRGPLMETFGPRSYDYLAFVAAPGQCAHPLRIELGPGEDIDRAAQAWRRDLDRSGSTLRLNANATISGAALRRLLWDPIAAALADTKWVYIIPDFSLELLPLAALPLDGGGVLIDQVGFSTLDSARDLVWWTRLPPPAGSGALLVGDVAYAAQSESAPRVATRSEDLSFRQAPPCYGAVEALPGTRAELRRVAWRLRASGTPVRRLNGTRATEANLSAGATGARILHLATHGYAPTDGCEAPSHDVPGALVGLALSGVNRTYDPSSADGDGLWSAEEIAGQDLRDTALVVLSACSSGLGKINDMDGVVSLRRAFAIAGAREIVYTLGPVPDRDTVALMDRFYKRYAHGVGAAEALLLAQREILSAQRRDGQVDPAAWAPFVVMGAWGDLTDGPR